MKRAKRGRKPINPADRKVAVFGRIPQPVKRVIDRLAELENKNPSQMISALLLESPRVAIYFEKDKQEGTADAS